MRLIVLISARPQELKRFVDDARGISRQAGDDVQRLRRAWDAFAAAPNEFGPRDTGLLAAGPAGVLGQQLDRWQRHETFVELVQHGFEQSDNLPGAKVTIGEWRLDWRMGDEARRRGIDLTRLYADPAGIVVPGPELASTPIPQDSGFTEDPVCTATGHYLETTLDLAMPARLAMLAWPRTYSSRHTVSGGHGRGWGSWASVAARRLADGRVVYTGPDGQRLRLRPGRRTPWLRASVAADPEGVTLGWDPRSDHPGETWRFRPDGTLQQVEAPDGSVTTAEYEDSRLLRLTHDSGRRLSVEWADDRISGVVSSCGRSVSYRYDDRGDLVEVRGSREPRRYRLDDRGRITATWDADGVRLCHNTYDAEGRVARQVSPFGRTTTFAYSDDRTTVVADTDGGPISRWEHDEDGRLIGLVAGGYRMARSFDDRGRLASVTGFDGITTAFDHGADEEPGAWTPAATVETDRAGCPTAITDGLGHTTIVEVHASGEIAALTLPDGTTWRIDRDDAGRPTMVTLPDGSHTELCWSPAGRLLQLGPLRFEYERDGTSCGAIGPGGHTVEAQYDRLERLVRLGDWRLDYSDLGLATTVTDPTGHTWTFAHDPEGRITEVMDPLGQATRYRRDPNGQATEVVDPDGTVTRLTYDDQGRPIRLESSEGIVATRRYTAAGRLVEEDGHRFSYDSAGRLREQVDPDGRRTSYRRDAVGRVTAVTRPSGATVELAHDPVGRVSAITDPLGHTTKYAWDGTGHSTTVTDPLGNATTFAWDDRGRCTATTDALGHTTRFRYDPLDRLTGIDLPSGQQVDQVLDPVGRLLELRVDGATVASADDATTWSPDDLPEPPPPDPRPRSYDRAGQLVAVDGWSFRYDAAGRLVHETRPDGTTRTYRYDAAHRLTRVDGPDPATFHYDALGRRISRRNHYGETRYRWDDLGRLASIERDGRTTEISSDPFGTLLGDHDVAPASDDPWATNLAGQPVFDGLVWLRNRVYDPATRQFLSPDPLPGDLGSPVLHNPYHYAGNDPLGHLDPLGLAPMSIDAYKQYKKVTTGVQWKHVVFAAEVGISVALMFTPLGPANAARMLAMAGPRIALSAGTKMAGMAINGSVQTAVWELAGQKGDEGLAWKDVRWGTVAKGMAFGGIATMFGGAVGPRVGAGIVGPAVRAVTRLPAKPANVVSSLTTSSALLGTTSAGYEAYDLTNLPGSDGQFTGTNVIASTLSAVPYTVAGGFVAPVKP